MDTKRRRNIDSGSGIQQSKQLWWYYFSDFSDVENFIEVLVGMEYVPEDVPKVYHLEGGRYFMALQEAEEIHAMLYLQFSEICYEIKRISI